MFMQNYILNRNFPNFFVCYLIFFCLLKLFYEIIKF